MLFLYLTEVNEFTDYIQIAVACRLVNVNESRFIRSCSFVGACFPQSVFLLPVSLIVS